MTGDLLLQVTGGQTQGASPARSSNVPLAPGLFQALLADQLTQTQNADAGWNDLLSLLSGLNPEQLAQLLALLGLSPDLNGSLSSLNLSDSSALVPDSAAQTAGTAAGQAGAAGLSVPAGAYIPQNNGSAKVSESAKQAGNALVSLLEQGGVSLPDALKSLYDSVRKEGLNLKEAFENLIRSVQRSIASKEAPQHSALSGGFLFSDSVVKTERRLEDPLMRQGTQIRPELQNLPGVSAQTDKPGGPDSGTESAKTAAWKAVVPPVTREGNEPPTSRQAGAGQVQFAQPVFSGALSALTNPSNNSGPAATGRAAHVTVPAEQFSAGFPSVVVKQAALIERGGMSEMRIRLVPEGLGEVHVRIVGENGQIALQLSADTQYARHLLDAGIGALKQQLEAQGLHVNRVEVVASAPSHSMSGGPGMFDGQKQQPQRDGQAPSPRKARNADAVFNLDESVPYQSEIAGIGNGQIDVVA